MITIGNELQVLDLVAAYAQSQQKTVLHFDLSTYNALDATKKATVNTYYAEFIDDYLLDIIKQGKFTSVSFGDEETALVTAGGSFPKLSQCPDADHYIHGYVIDTRGDITWENV